MAHPTLTTDHGRNTSNTMSERHTEHSHLTMRGTNLVMSKRPSTHIRSWEEHIQEPYRKGSTLISYHGRNTSYQPCKKGTTLISYHGRNTSYQPCKKGSQSQTEILGNWPGASILPENGIWALKLSFSPRLKFPVNDQVPPFSQRMESQQLSRASVPNWNSW